jgi:probable rRNA maturation factor
MSLTTSSTLRQTPRLKLGPIADTILGRDYAVSLVFIGPDRARHLNQETRGKDYVPNVLSFELDEQNGEIYICPAAAKPEAVKFELSEKGYLTYLFIHGCLHLTGLKHGPEMDRLEERFKKRFDVK